MVACADSDPGLFLVNATDLNLLCRLRPESFREDIWAAFLDS